MRMSTMIAGVVSVAALLVAAPSAGAYAKPSGTLCEGSTCFTVQDTDRYDVTVTDGQGRGWGWLNTGTMKAQMHYDGCTYTFDSLKQWQLSGSPHSTAYCVYVGGEYVGHRLRRYRYPDIPDQDIDSFSSERTMNVTELWSYGQMIRRDVTVREGYKVPKGPYCSFYTGTNTSGLTDSRVALDRTPRSIWNDCGFTHFQRFNNLLDQTESAVGTAPEGEAPFSIPASSTKCGAVAAGSSRVVVRSSRYRCGSAKSVIKRYARTLKSPAGWSCTAIVRDDRLRAKCRPKTTGKAARKAIYGIWVRR